jgi:hypothetical protein
MTIPFISVGAAQVMVLLASQVFLPFFYVSFLASILALDDKPKPRRQSRPVLWEVWCRSLRKPLICQPLAGNAVNEAVKAHKSMVLDIAFIEPEGKFVNVTAKMLTARVMIDANQAALEHGENTFNSVSGDGAANIFTSAVIDSFVLERAGLDAVIGPGFIRVEHRADFNALRDRGLDGCLVGASNRNGNRSAAALAHTENGCFSDSPAPGFQLLGFVLVLFDAADKRFVDFDDAFELAQIVAAASFPQAVQHEPSRLLRDPNFLGELHGRYALARRHKQVHGINPLVQRNVAALENRAGAHRKVFLALVAAIEAASPRRDPLAHAANRALRAVRPQPPFKIRSGRFLVREHLEKLEGRNRALGHRVTPDLRSEYASKSRGSQVYKSLC